MCNKDLTIRCGFNTLQFNSTQPLATQNDSHAIQPDPNSTQPNTTQHIQFKVAQRILGSRSTTLVIFGYWSTSHSTIQQKKKTTTQFFGARGEVRCQVASLPVFNQQKPGARSCLRHTAQVYSNHHCGEKKGREEKAYECVTEGEHGLFRIMHEGKEALITLTRYKDDAEQKLEQLFKGKSKEQERSIPPPNLTVNLPQLSLPTFNGEPRQWRQFWSSFNAAVHSQTIPEIQKLNYLFSCLRGNASQVVSGYEIAPENYELEDCLKINMETPRQ
uniref:Uncharacterized protein n=1 Tax=Loa loa TaxID=7209 RepID=A0A1I7VYV3_LOALO